LQEEIVPQVIDGTIILQGNTVTQAWSNAPRIAFFTMVFETPAPLASRKNLSIPFVTLWVRIGITRVALQIANLPLSVGE